MLGVGRKLADALGEPLQAAVLGSGVQDIAQIAIHHGADAAYVAESEGLAQYQTSSYTKAMAAIVQHVDPTILLIGMTDNGRDLGPRLAFRLHTGLASDCVDLAINPETKLMEATRPVSGGNAMAQPWWSTPDRKWPLCGPKRWKRRNRIPSVRGVSNR
jgi:electron transfer flavoprotein alpha subunit